MRFLPVENCQLVFLFFGVYEIWKAEEQSDIWELKNQKAITTIMLS